MTTVVSDPTSLTKDKLKKELSRHNITLPPKDSKKEVFVQLYTKHLLEKSEFSSDDDNSFGGGSGKRKLQKKSVTKKIVAAPVSEINMDVYSLSDKDLGSALKAHGVNIGPIMDTTRKVYQKKLEKLLNGPSSAPPPPVEEDDYSDQDDEEPEPEPVPTRSSSSRSYRRTQIMQDPPAEPSPSPPPPPPPRPQVIRGRTEVHTERVSSRVQEPVRQRVVPPASTSLPQTLPAAVTQEVELKPAKKSIAVWIQVIIFAAIALLIFIVIQNMEPGSKNPAKGQLEG